MTEAVNSQLARLVKARQLLLDPLQAHLATALALATMIISQGQVARLVKARHLLLDPLQAAQAAQAALAPARQVAQGRQTRHHQPRHPKAAVAAANVLRLL